MREDTGAFNWVVHPLYIPADETCGAGRTATL